MKYFKLQINTKTYSEVHKISLLEVGNWFKNLLLGDAKIICNWCQWFKGQELIANLWINNLSIFFSFHLNVSSIWSICWPIRATSIIIPSTFAFINSWFHPYGRSTSPFGPPPSSLLQFLPSSTLGSIHMVDMLAHSSNLHEHSFDFCPSSTLGSIHMVDMLAHSSNLHEHSFDFCPSSTLGSRQWLH
jgi:hypothetical protein